MPRAAGFLEKAGPAFAAYAAGQHETALAAFMTAVSGLDWEACRALLDERVPGAIAQAIKDADTFFGVELPSLGVWTFGAEQAAASPSLSSRCSVPTPSRCGSKWPTGSASGSGRSRTARSRALGHLLHMHRAGRQMHRGILGPPSPDWQLNWEAPRGYSDG